MNPQAIYNKLSKNGNSIVRERSALTELPYHVSIITDIAILSIIISLLVLGIISELIIS